MISQLKKHAKYIEYIAKHKWFVFLECAKMGILLRGVTHDASKFRPDEWFPYCEYFYGKKTDKVEEDFDKAWLQHIHRNPHHHQHWVLREDTGIVKVLEMPEPIALEMVADWRGAGKAQGFDSVRDWYKKEQDKMVLHPNTRAFVEHLLRQLGELD